MLAYVTTHFVNHSLGLVSLRAMDDALVRIYGVWASLPGTIILYGAFSIHYVLALWALWRRRTLRMPAAEATQLVLGFFIPLVLAARWLRWQLQRWRGVVRLRYPSGRIVEMVPGHSVLEASRLAGIPHASV